MVYGIAYNPLAGFFPIKNLADCNGQVISLMMINARPARPPRPSGAPNRTQSSYQCVALLLVTAGGILAGEPSFSSDQSPHEMMVNTLRNDGDITSFMAD
jgi:hypothetical protein